MNRGVRTSGAISALWGFAEGTFFFVVPDVLFTRTTLLSVKRGWLQLLAAVIGATMAGAGMYQWASGSPAQARSAVAAVPFLGENIIAPAEQRWNDGGTHPFQQSTERRSS